MVWEGWSREASPYPDWISLYAVHRRQERATSPIHCIVTSKPRMVGQTYLGTAERVAGLVCQNAAPVPPYSTGRRCLT